MVEGGIMALSIDTCNDIEKYEESVVAGLNAKKTICVAIALVCGGITSLMLYYLLHWQMIFCVYGATPITGVVIMFGFYEKDGMDFIGMLKNRLQKNQNKPICYISTETKSEYERHNKDIVKVAQTKEDADKEFEKIKKIAIIGTIGAISVVILIIVLLIVLI